MLEAIVDAIATWDYTRLLVLVALAAIIGPPATIYLLRRRNGNSKHLGERVASVESDVASLKDEFRNTVQQLEERLARQHKQTRDEVRELADAVRGEATSISDEFRLLRQQLTEKKAL